MRAAPAAALIASAWAPATATVAAGGGVMVLMTPLVQARVGEVEADVAPVQSNLAE